MQYYTGIIHGGPKVALWFRGVTMGEYFHTQRYHHVNSIGKNGTFKAGWHSDLVRECVRVLGERPNRRDRISITRYRGLYILGRIYTVMKDRRQRELLEPAYYSMIDKLLKIKQ
jgi:hypothetical protein